MALVILKVAFIGGLLLMIWALTWDRIRGGPKRPRCPGRVLKPCWYDMSGSLATMQCPECGREFASESQLHRAHVHRIRACLGGVAVGVSVAVMAVHFTGPVWWVQRMPGPALVRFAPIEPAGADDLLFNELDKRIVNERLSSGQVDFMAKRCCQVIADSHARREQLPALRLLANMGASGSLSFDQLRIFIKDKNTGVARAAIEIARANVIHDPAKTRELSETLIDKLNWSPMKLLTLQDAQRSIRFVSTSCLSSSQRFSRPDIIRMLGELARSDSMALARLIEMVEREDGDLIDVSFALCVAGASPTRFGESTASMKAVLEKYRPFAPELSLLIEMMTREYQDHIDTAIHLATYGTDDDRIAAAEYLCRHRDNIARVLPTVEMLLADSNIEVRRAAVKEVYRHQDLCLATVEMLRKRLVVESDPDLIRSLGWALEYADSGG